MNKRYLVISSLLHFFHPYLVDISRTTLHEEVSVERRRPQIFEGDGRR